MTMASEPLPDTHLSFDSDSVANGGDLRTVEGLTDSAMLEEFIMFVDDGVVPEARPSAMKGKEVNHGGAAQERY